MANNLNTLRFDHVIALLIVIGLHGTAFYFTMYYQPTPSLKQPPTVFVSLINAPQKEEISIPKPAPPEPPKRQPKKIKRIKKNKPKPLLVQERIEDALTIAVEETPLPEPVANDLAIPEAAPTTEALATSEPVSSPEPEQLLPASIDLSSELSLACKHRTPPNYPSKSIQLGEQGRVVLRVALDEAGNITTINIKTSSGHSRLDKAGIEAIKSWRCNAAKRNGKNIPSTALQPFDFILD